MKALLKSIFERTGLYNAFRYSKLYHEILRFKNPAYYRYLHDDVEFYRRAVGGRMALVFDVGANIGDKTWAFSKLAKRVVCVEPDAHCFKGLQARFRFDKSVHLENVALGDKEGTASFFVEEQGSAYNTLSEKQREWVVGEHRPAQMREVKVRVTTLDSLIKKYGVPDFIKIDVEGYELPVFQGFHSQVGVVCFEANLPRFAQETFQILKRYEKFSSALFNLRKGDKFVFDNPQPYATTIDFLGATNGEVSYDIFIYSNANT